MPYFSKFTIDFYFNAYCDNGQGYNTIISLLITFYDEYRKEIVTMPNDSAECTCLLNNVIKWRHLMQAINSHRSSAPRATGSIGNSDTQFVNLLKRKNDEYLLKHNNILCL